MTLGEGVVSELDDDVEEFLAEFVAISRLDATLFELVALLFHDLANLLSAGLAQVVGLGERIPRELLRHAHHALLVDHESEGVAEDVCRVLVEIRDLLALVLVVGEVVVHVGTHRTRAIQRENRRQIFESARDERAQQRTHRRGLELEDPDGVALRQEFIRGLVVDRNRIDVEVRVPALANHRLGIGDHVKVAQAEDVHLQQTELLHPVHFVLGDHRCLCGVLPLLGLALDRQIFRQWFLGDHHRSSVNANRTLQSLETTRHVDDALHVGVRVVQRAKILCGLIPGLMLGILLEAVLDRCVTTHDDGRHRLGDLVAERVRIAEHSCRVTHRIACLDRAEGDDLGDAIATVLLRRITNHLVAVSRVEVHVDVGHADSARVQEALEQQVVLDRIEVRDSEAVRDRTTRSRSTTRADPNVVFLGIANEVPHDQEVRRESHVADHLQLIRQPVGDFLGQFRSPTRLGPFECEVCEIVAIGGETLRQREIRQDVLAELDLHVCTLCDPQGVVACFGHLAEQVPHLVGGLQVVLVALELESIGVRDRAPGLDAQQGVVTLVIFAVRVVGVVGRQQRSVDRLGQLDQQWIRAHLICETVVLQFDEEVVATEDLLQSARTVVCTLHVAAHQSLQHVTAEAAARCDETRAVLLEKFPVDARLVVVALQECATGEVDQVLVPDVVLCEQREVVVDLAATLGLAARVVDASTSRRTLAAVLVGHVGLGADDRLDALLGAFLVEVDDPVHVAVVGDAERWLTVRLRLGHQFAETRGPVQHRKLGVNVQVGE